MRLKQIARSVRPLAVILWTALHAPSSAFADGPMSFRGEVLPILTRSCAGCHRPEKLKGKLDLTSFAAMAKGGKHGPAFFAGDAAKSPLVQQVSGDDPPMPEKGERLSGAEVAILSRWVAQGAKDDTPAVAGVVPASPSPAGVAPPGPPPPAVPPAYAVAPVVSALAASPDGRLLAVGGYFELLIHRADGTGLIARVPSGSPRTTSLAFSPDGQFLVAAGGAAGEFGQLQVWSAADWHLLHNYQTSRDTLFGLSLSPTADRAAVACADRSVHVLELASGKELARFDQHTDWALCTAFTADGTKLVSGGRDKAVRLFDLAPPRQIDQLNEAVEPLLCLARDPLKAQVVAGGAEGVVRVYNLEGLKRRTDETRDPNRVREIERQSGTVNAAAFSKDGKYLALGSTGEARIYAESDGHRVATCAGHRGAIFTLAFSPDGTRLYTGGYDGQVRIFDAARGTLLKTFVPTPGP